MKSSFLSILASFVFAGQSLAQIKYEGPSKLGGMVDQACVDEAYSVVQRYIDLFVLSSDVEKVRFNSLVNTTQGTYRQQFFANITLFDSRGAEYGEDESTMEFTFESIEACYGLQILNVVDKGIDKNNPLYACLNDPITIAPLKANLTKAWDNLAAFDAVCNSVEAGSERVKCYAELKKTSESQELYSLIKAADEQLDKAVQACRD